MEKHISNRKKVILFFVVGVILYAIISILCSKSVAYAQEDSSYINIQEELHKMFGKEPDLIDKLYNLDEQEDFIYIEFSDAGYAIFNKSNFELLEFSEAGTPPYHNIDDLKYYAGPSKYYIKKDNNFYDLILDETLNTSDIDKLTLAKTTREMFVNNQDVYYNIDDNEERPTAPSYGTPIDAGKIGTYIPNAQYFLSSPMHGYNSVGTCTSVAVQLILSYHNFYSDRRIIEEQYLFSENNPNTTIDPMEMTSKTLGSRDEYYNYITNLIDPSESASWGRENFLKNTENQIKNILNSKGISHYVSMQYSETGAINASRIYEIINSGQPVLLALDDGGSFNHSVVAYGYRDYTYATGEGTYSGYVVHCGWDRKDPNNFDYTMGDGYRNVWVNSAWCDSYTNIIINHDHIYDTYIGGNYHEEKCSTCGHRKYAYTTEIQSIDEVSITGLTQDITGAGLIIPRRINGRFVTSIGNGVFDGQNTLETVLLPASLEEIGENAFSNCTQLSTITMPSTLVTIGSSAFAWCSALEEITIPSGVQRIEEGTFGASGLVSVEFESNETITYIGVSAFGYCGNLTDLILPHSVTSIGISAFAFTSLSYIVVPYNCVTIGNNAFNSCSNLTIYTGRSAVATNWGSNWNNSSRPVVWGCSLSDDIVISFVKTDNNPTSTTNINNPERKGYTFDGWYTTADFSGTSYDDITQAPNGTLYAKWTEKSCVAEGTMVTLADGSEVAVESLSGNEQLLVWNLLTGSYDVAPILFVDCDELSSYRVIELTFSDGTEVKVIDEHGFWCFELNEYVYLDENASNYVGYHFNKKSGDSYTSVTLVGVEIYYETTRAYSPVTYGHLCYFVNGMLSMPGGIGGLFNIFEVDATTMSYDQEAMEEDIEEYGLYTYEEFTQEVVVIPEEIFNAFNGAYLKVAIGKGLITEEEIVGLAVRYAEFF